MSIFSLFYCVIVMILGRRENGTESYTLLARKTYLSINRLLSKKVARDKAIKLINDLLIEAWTFSQKLGSRSMYTTLCKGTLGQKERNILQTSDVRWTDRLINLGCLQALYTCKFLVLFLKLIMVATMLTIKQDNTIFQPCNFSQYILDKLFYWNLSMCQISKIDPCT